MPETEAQRQRRLKDQARKVVWAIEKDLLQQYGLGVVWRQESDIWRRAVRRGWVALVLPVLASLDPPSSEKLGE